MTEEKTNSAKNMIKKALMINYNDLIADCFIKYVDDEGFDEDETLIDDIQDVELDDLDNCSVVLHLAEKNPKTFPEGKKQENLLTVLQNALKGELGTGSGVGIIDPKTVQWKISRQEAKDATNFVEKMCPNLMEKKDKTDKALMDVVAIGMKNDFPLLNWLTDTYSRFRINNYYLNKPDFATVGWKKKYKFLNSLEKSQKRAAEKLDSSIKSFFKRMFNSIMLHNTISVFDDNINEYIEYFIAMNEAIQTLATKNIVPFQVDMWIIPANVESAIGTADDDGKDIDSGDEEDDTEFEEIGADKIGNLDYRLKTNKFKYESVMNEHKEKIKRNFAQQLESFISGRSQRIIIYIDRRNPKYVISENKCADYIKNNYGLNCDDNGNSLQKEFRDGRKASNKKKTWNDKIYFVQTNEKKYNEIPSEHTPETSFWSSTQCMLPQVNGENMPQDKGYGCRNDFNGFQFMLSWHVDSSDLIRCYWFSNCWGARFFPLDCAMLWPKYFKEVKNKEQSVKPDYNKKLKSMEQCVDAGFKHWFETTTGTKLTLFS